MKVTNDAPQLVSEPKFVDTSEHIPGESFIAAAPRGMSAKDLGRPYTVDFVRLQGVEGQTLFPNAGTPSKTGQNIMEHSFVIAENERTLAANASAWGIVGVGFSTKTTQRYASYRAVQIDSVYEVDDTTELRQSRPHAIYYPWRIYYGRSYEVLFEGDADRFHAGVKAKIFMFSGGVDDFAGEYNLKQKTVGHGLKPATNRAIFAKTHQQIEQNYKQSTSPVPVLVEWREIPGRTGYQEDISWNAPKYKPCPEWEFDYIEWKIQKRKTSGSRWDADGSPPDVVLTLRSGSDTRTSPKREHYDVKWRVEPPLRVKPGATVSLYGRDRDLVADDRIDRLQVTVSEEYPNNRGRVEVHFESGGATMKGRCVARGRQVRDAKPSRARRPR
ncbi:MAG: hypothetical protein ACPG4T_19245, partial [Nannocystaceae bacterium]